MPAATGWKQRNFSFRLLNPAFSKKEESIVQRFEQRFGGVSFGDCDKLGRLGGGPGSPLHRGLDGFLDLG